MMEPVVYLNKPRLKQKLAEYGFDAVVGADSRNVTYLSDVRTFDTQWALPEAGTAVIVPADDIEQASLCISAHYVGYLLQRPSWIERVFLWDWFGYFSFLETVEDHGDDDSLLKKDIAQFVVDHTDGHIANDIVDVTVRALQAMGLTHKKVAFDDLRLANYVKQRLPGLQISDAHDMLIDVNKCASVAEIRVMQEGATIAQQAMENVIAAMKPGVMWSELAHIHRMSLAERGAIPTTDKGLMWGSHYKGQHVVDNFYLPDSDFALEAGRAYIIENYSIYNGFTTDGSRTVFLGDPPAEYLKIVDAVMQCYSAIEAHLRPGVDSGLVYETVMAIMAESGVPCAQKISTATHGVGLQPVGWYVPYPAFTKIPQSYMLEENQMLGMDVLYYGHEVFPFHMENQLLVTADGPRSFYTQPTVWPRGLQIMDNGQRSSYFPDIPLNQELGIDL